MFGSVTIVARRCGVKVVRQLGRGILFSTRFRDTFGGMYIISMKALRDALMEIGDFSIETQMVAHMVNTGKAVREVLIEYRLRVNGKKLDVLDGMRILMNMVRPTTRYNLVLILFLLELYKE